MERDRRIDILRAWGIILVVAGHSGSSFGIWIYTFHMPLFFFISGFLRYNAKQKDWKTFIKSKLISSLLPYVIFWVISVFLYNNIFYLATAHKFAPSLGIKEVKGLLFGGHWLADHSNNFPLWYLQLYFIAIILFEVLVRYLHPLFLWIAFFLISYVTIPFQNLLPGRPIFHINVLPMALSFLLVGYAFQWMLKKIKMLDELTNRYAVGGTLILFGFLMSMKHGGYISQINSYLYISGAICTIIGFYILSNIFVKCKLLQNIGKNSLYILERVYTN